MSENVREAEVEHLIAFVLGAVAVQDDRPIDAHRKAGTAREADAKARGRDVLRRDFARPRIDAESAAPVDERERARPRAADTGLAAEVRRVGFGGAAIAPVVGHLALEKAAH